MKEQKKAIVPAVFVEMELDNRKGRWSRRYFFGFQGSNPYFSMRRLDDVSKGNYIGVGNGLQTAMVKALEGHLKKILQPGICKFPNGGWKLSSANVNSWLSKIYLSQSVAEQILGLPSDKKADKIHFSWLLDPANIYFAWSDQMHDGKAGVVCIIPEGSPVGYG